MTICSIADIVISLATCFETGDLIPEEQDLCPAVFDLRSDLVGKVFHTFVNAMPPPSESAMTDRASAEHPLETLVEIPNELHAALASVLSEGDFQPAHRVDACLAASSLALEHASGVRALMAVGLATSATGLMRLHFEALTRTMQLLYAAKDPDIEKLLAPLTPDAEQAAKNLPSVSAMIDTIGKNVGARASNAGRVSGHVVARHELIRARRDSSASAPLGRIPGGPHPAAATQFQWTYRHDGHDDGRTLRR